MTMMKKLPISIIIGGKDINEKVLNDAWILNFQHLCWLKVKLYN